VDVPREQQVDREQAHPAPGAALQAPDAGEASEGVVERVGGEQVGAPELLHGAVRAGIAPVGAVGHARDELDGGVRDAASRMQIMPSPPESRQAGDGRRKRRAFT
jgi:hypothetical protein